MDTQVRDTWCRFLSVSRSRRVLGFWDSYRSLWGILSATTTHSRTDPCCFHKLLISLQILDLNNYKNSFLLPSLWIYNSKGFSCTNKNDFQFPSNIDWFSIIKTFWFELRVVRDDSGAAEKWQNNQSVSSMERGHQHVVFGRTEGTASCRDHRHVLLFVVFSQSVSFSNVCLCTLL